ncbi:MAG: hypothetical protein EB064_11110 [Betaproteobacteria bacterium]|nr:hypothetical protein [Betaproteobacteria bacterium]
MLDTVHGGGAGRCGLHGVIPFVSWLEFAVRDGKPFSSRPLQLCGWVRYGVCKIRPLWYQTPRLGALLLVRDQAAVAFSFAAVPRPAASSLMPLRRTPRRPDPAR